MRIKRDYMGNDQLLPAYNLQLGICSEYIAVYDVNQYASDVDCFIPLIEKFKNLYNKYPKYPVGDAGYGSYNNYIYAQNNGMEKYLKFPMFRKETKDMKFHKIEYRSVNFRTDEFGDIRCPNNKKFNFLYHKKVRNNNYGRTEEIYQCEDCSNCELRVNRHKSPNNRIIHLNRELTTFHKEVIDNLESDFGIELRKLRSIQSEGTFGIIKYDRNYKRIVRRGLKAVNLEVHLISIGFNLYKYYNKKNRIVN